MRKYWGKITLSALLIFVVGYGLVSAGRAVKENIVSGKAITIPLGPFVPFKLDEVKVGNIRSITIQREGHRRLTGFNVRVRLADTAAFTRLQECLLSVNDARNFDERTSFVCLASDSGYQAFGEVSILMSIDGERHLVRPLLLPVEVVQDMMDQDDDEDAGSSWADSVAQAVETRVRPLSRAHRDSIRAAELDERAATYKARADSLRGQAKPNVPNEANPPAQPPKPL